MEHNFLFVSQLSRAGMVWLRSFGHPAQALLFCISGERPSFDRALSVLQVDRLHLKKLEVSPVPTLAHFHGSFSLFRCLASASDLSKSDIIEC